MRTTIDKAGRVVIPKPIRDALGFDPGRDLDVTIVDGKVEIAPAPVGMRLVRRGKGLVAVPDVEIPTLGTDDVRSVLEQTRR